MEVQVERVRKVGNAGVVVQTTTKEELKNAAPPTLRVETPRAKPSQVRLRNLDGDPGPNEILEALYEQNWKQTEWSL